MTNILSLISNPASPAIDTALLSAIKAHIGNADFTELSENIAYETPIGDGHNLADIRKLIGDKPIDANIVKDASRKKKLLIADMDSTIIQQECIDEIAEFAGKRTEISDITERAMRGELDFEEALKARVAMLQGLSESVLEEAYNSRIHLTPGAITLVQTMNNTGALTALVSGGFTFFTARVSAACGFQHNQANQLLVENNALTGKVALPILGREAKEEALVKFVAGASIDIAETIAVGDGANDLSMLGRAGLGVAFHAKPAVAEAADAQIDHGDLTALLYLQGYRDEDFVTPAASIADKADR